MHCLSKLKMTAKFMTSLSITSDDLLIGLLYVRSLVNIADPILVPSPCLSRPFEDDKDAYEDFTHAAHDHDQQKTILGKLALILEQL